MLMSPDDLEQLTGCKYAASQIKWLRNNGVRYLVGADGKPKVMRSQIESLIGAINTSSVKKRVEPNFSKLEKILNGA